MIVKLDVHIVAYNYFTVFCYHLSRVVKNSLSVVIVIPFVCTD